MIQYSIRKYQRQYFCQLNTEKQDEKFEKFQDDLKLFAKVKSDQQPRLRVLSIILFSLLWDLKGKYQEFKYYLIQKIKGNKLKKLDTGVKFDDIIGIDSYKDEILEIVEYFKDKKKFQKLGAEIPKGVLLYGKPGTGKTMLAQALANESGVNFIYKSSSELLSKYLGQSSNNVRKIFEEANKKQPCIIFIDEIETIAGNRNHKLMIGDTINQLLVQMDGFKKNDQVIVIGATNRLHAIDPAILRPGRFDKIIQIPVPNKEARKQILNHYLKKVNLNQSLDLNHLIEKSSSLTGADIKNLVNIAALNAVSEKRKQISQIDIDYAFDKIMMGNVRENDSEQIYQLKSAYTQSGIALMSQLKQQNSMIHKISIKKKKQKQSASSFIKNEQEEFITKGDLWNTMLVNGACRATEKVFFGEEDFGNYCLDYLKNNELLAKKYLRYFNKNFKLSPYVFKKQSQKLKSKFDKELNQTLQQIEKDSLVIIEQNKEKIINIAKELLLKKTLEKDEIKNILKN